MTSRARASQSAAEAGRRVDAEPPVLVVGAGPTGLVLALQLLRYGVPFRLIEKRVDPASGSKALSMNAVSLQLLDTLQLAGVLVRGGHRTRRLTLLYDGRRLTRVDVGRLPLSFPFFLMRPQPETEAVMRAALVARSAARCDPVEAGTELVEVVTGDGSVQVSLRRPDDSSEERSFEYVVACDGARSAVRTGLNIPFRGYDYGMHFALADVRIEWPGNKDEGYYFVTDDTFLILLPLGCGYHRIVVKMDGPFDGNATPCLDDLRRKVAQCGIPKLELKSAAWLSRAPFYNRLAGSLQESNVFLAGDAAHLFSPIGGLGMNTGIGDAFNLGWKLAYVNRGWSPPSLLTSYVAERSKVARELLAQTDLLTSLIARLDRHERADEERFLPSTRSRAFRRELAFRLTGMAQAYGDAPMSTATSTVSEAMMLPYHAGFYRCISGRARGRHLLLAAAPSTERARQRFGRAVTRVRRSFGHCVLVRSLEPGDGALEAEGGRTSAKALGLDPGEAVLVRPDFYVERRALLDEGRGEMIEYLDWHYRAPRGHSRELISAGRSE